MNKFKSIGKWMVSAMLCMVLTMMLTVSVWAANDVPELVMNARDGVVRIVVGIDGQLAAFGTGFIVGTEDKYYVVTNHHVIEDTTDIWIMYDTGKYVEATIYEDSPRRDLCILKPKRKIPDAKVLPIQTDDFDTGAAVYALGYPGAADKMTGDYYRYEQLTDIVADKSSMTITDGIISSIKTADTVGDSSHSVKIIQTNTAFSGGNSGGPLLDKDGNVVGINTFVMVGEGVSGINGSVHVSELMSVLRIKKIDYLTAEDAAAARAAETAVPEEDSSNVLFIGIMVALVVVAAGAILTIVLVYRKKNRQVQDNGNNPYQNNYPTHGGGY